ncbi:MAG: NrpR regulatory domain-containing protein [Armatimonadota bacterium]
MDSAAIQPLSDDRDVRRKMLAILRVLSGSDEPLGARAIGRELETLGIELSERQVRYHLQFMDERGLTFAMGIAGRVLTDKGRHELDSAQVADKVGFVAARIDRLAYSTTFDVETGEGEVILNVSLLAADDLPVALEHARVASDAGLCMSDLAIVAHEGEQLGETVPEGMVAVGTVCSVTLNGVLLHNYIPVNSVYGGLLQMRESRPLRFVELVRYTGSSIDPLHIFIASGLTSSWEAATTGSGMVGAGFREIPAVAVDDALELIERLKEYRLNGVLAVGAPGQPLLELPVGMDRVGLVVVGGLTPMAAASERGVKIDQHAMSTTCEYSLLKPIDELV